jgi:hypothetical protein
MCLKVHYYGARVLPIVRLGVGSTDFNLNSVSADQSVSVFIAAKSHHYMTLEGLGVV